MKRMTLTTTPAPPPDRACAPSRRAFLAASAAAAVVRPSASVSARAKTVVGLDRVATGALDAWKGKKLGLLGHGASVSPANGGAHAIDVMRKAGLDLVRLFGPEHGLRGQAAAGEKVADGVDGPSGLPVVSLYGSRQKPEKKDLEGLDALVVDLQDAGVRFYTFASTMLLCLEACAENKVEMIVLDRPNPLGGARLEGPVSDPPLELARSLVNMTPGPLVHGLTLGELAQVANDGRTEPLKLTVVTMEGWTRATQWPGTGLPWPTPSPNLRSAEAALAYPGTCLLEGTIATEGRGTDAPFLVVGAPWVDADRLARDVRVPGFALAAETFTPTASPAAPRPKFMNEVCRGVRIRATDWAAAEPFRLGVALLSTLRKHSDFAWRGDGSGFDRLVGTKTLRAAIDRGDSVEGIVDATKREIALFREKRAKNLLYA